MATDLKVRVRRQIDQLKKELAAATGRVVALRDEVKRHEMIYDMLDGRKMRKRSRRGRCQIGPLKRGPRGTMIDWNEVFAPLPDQFTLDVISANETASEKPRSYLRQVAVRWSKEGRIKRAGRGMYRKSVGGAIPVPALMALPKCLHLVGCGRSERGTVAELGRGFPPRPNGHRQSRAATRTD